MIDQNHLVPTVEERLDDQSINIRLPGGNPIGTLYVMVKVASDKWVIKTPDGPIS